MLTASSIKTGRRKLESIYAQLLQKRLEKIGVLSIIQSTLFFNAFVSFCASRFYVSRLKRFQQ